MSSRIAAKKGTEVVLNFDVVQASDGKTLVTGKASAIEKALHANKVAASEAITVTEIGTSGYYYGTFTPLLGGLDPTLYTARLTEPAGESPALAERQHIWDIQVYDSLPAEAGPTADLTTLPNVREALGFTATQLEDDNFLTRLIARVSDWIKERAEQTIVQATFTEVYNGPGDPLLFLREGPVISVTTLHESLEHTFDAASLVPAADYEVDDDLGAVFRKGAANWIKWWRSIQVVYVAGYASVPLWMEDYAIRKVIEGYRRRSGDQEISRTLANGTIVYRQQGEDSDEDKHFYARLRRGGGIL